MHFPIDSTSQDQESNDRPTKRRKLDEIEEEVEQRVMSCSSPETPIMAILQDILALLENQKSAIKGIQESLERMTQ
jgi:hypothetical protein